jgi:hypothetical protein
MRFPPPEVLATFPKPNYVDPVERGPGLMIVELTLLPIAVICVALRLWVRIGWLRKGWWDDWLMVVAVVSLQPQQRSERPRANVNRSSQLEQRP